MWSRLPPVSSPEASAISVRTTPPASSGIAAPIVGDRGTGTTRVATVPAAHESALPSSSTASAGCRPPPVPWAATRSATPANPATSASDRRRDGGAPPGSAQPSNGTKSGIVARHRAAIPDGVRSSAYASTPWQPTKSSTPSTTAPPHSRRLGQARPRSRAMPMPSRMAPPSRQRAAIIANGGIVSTA